MTAAVADFCPAEAQARKIKKEAVSEIKLERTRDILAEIASQRRPGQLVVGFAAETDHVIENAAAKLHAKRLDLIVANDVTQDGAGFEVDTNVVTLLFPDGRERPLELLGKFNAAIGALVKVVMLGGTGVRFKV